MRWRDMRFVAQVRRVMAEGGFPLSDVQKRDVATTTRPTLMKPDAQVAWVDAKLRQPDVRAALSEVFAELGMSIPWLLAKHKEHIEGGNYAALRDLEKFVMPTPPTRHQIDQRVLTATIEAPRRDGPPVMQARLLGTARVETAIETSE